MSKHRTVSWCKEVVPDAIDAGPSVNILGLRYAAKAGVGVAPLPMSLGDAGPDLIRVIGPVPEFTRAWRILTHPNQRHTAAFSAFSDVILRESDASQPILSDQS